jgi:homoserine kinase type II
MAVYTALTQQDFADLLAHYELGALIDAAGITEGVENTNYALKTEAGRFVLTIFEKRAAEADLPFFMAVMARLAERGFPAPRPISGQDGAVLTRVKGKPACLVTHLEGVWPRAPTLAQCAVIGEALAHMHRSLEGFEPVRSNALSVDGWEALIRPRLGLAESLRAGLAAEIEEDMDETRMNFYFACTDFLAYDLAVCLNAWCFAEEREYDLARGRAMIGAYEAVRPLSPAERAALPTLARGAALRFFATRLADWTATPSGALVKPKDPLEYADKLAFHRAAGVARYGD